MRGYAMRFSLAGVQLKFSAIIEARGELTIPVERIGGSWIVEFPSSAFSGVPANEYSMMNLARLIGIDVPPVKLFNLNELDNVPEELEKIKGQEFAVKRFDRREDGSAVHTEDFAQVFNAYPHNKYKLARIANIAEVIA